MMNKEIKNFTELECWKSARNLRLYLSQLIIKFLKEEKYRLVDQIVRAARSVTNNIAEGYGRFHYQENIQFCRQSRGSLYELKDHLIISKDENFISDEEFQQSNKFINEELALLNGYINYLKRAKEQVKND